MKLSQYQDHPEILMLSRDQVRKLQLTLKESINAELIRAEFKTQHAFFGIAGGTKERFD